MQRDKVKVVGVFSRQHMYIFLHGKIYNIPEQPESTDGGGAADKSGTRGEWDDSCVDTWAFHLPPQFPRTLSNAT